MTDEETAAQEMREGKVALRLGEQTPVYRRPDASSEVMSVLPEGALVTVREESGDFLHVITPSDSFGYIRASTSVRPLEAMSLAVEEPDDTPAPEARRGPEAGQAAGAVPASAMPPKARPDDSWEPTPFTLAPSERVLIYDRIAANRRSTLFLMAFFVVFLAVFFAAVGAFIAAYSGTPAEDLAPTAIAVAIVAAVIALPVGAVMYFAAPATVLGISGVHEVTKAEEPVLYRVVENLCIGAGLPMPKVYVIEDSAPNAFATGRGPNDAYVVATRGLLDKLDKRELQGVMAHELSHVGNYDIRIMTLLAVMVGLVALLADLLLRFTWYGAGARSSNRGRGGGAIGLLILVGALIFIIVAPLAATVMRLAVSRQREYLADSSGALLCRDPEALADALEKISKDPEPLEVANKATAHLYIANPLKGHESFMNNLFATHPPVEERIRLLRAMA